MPDNPDIETEIVHAAYAVRVKDAFMIFADNLAIGQTEKSCKERFLRSLLMVKRARDLALETISGENIVEQPEPRAETAADPLSAEHRALIEQAVGGTTGIAKPVPREPIRYR